MVPFLTFLGYFSLVSLEKIFKRRMTWKGSRAIKFRKNWIEEEIKKRRNESEKSLTQILSVEKIFDNRVQGLRVVKITWIGKKWTIKWQRGDVWIINFICTLKTKLR